MRLGSGRARVTLQIIAEQLAVSTATVSLALRNSPLVAEATRLRVQILAREMGYSYNRSAASLRTDRTNILGVGFHDITNPYFAELLAAIEETAAERGRSILLATYGEKLDRQERALTTLKEYRPDGMIVCAAGGSTAESFTPLIVADMPLVQLSREIPGLDLDFVGSDDRHGTVLALEHLIGLGHRRIAFLGENQLISTARNRYEGYRDTLAGHGLSFDPALVYAGYGTRESGLKGVQHVLDATEPPTAAICFNDLTAFGAMLGLRHRGREAGADFSIVGCDDVQEAAQWYPALTTIKNFQGEMGRRSAELLIRRIAEPAAPVRRIVLTPELVVRGTTAPPRA
ncbi:LacI family DNA-binding transcriptional regulator [Bosea caraganae]|uniref:LacI family DNA-binding transcriptional regulator n=2 Tax=Bosea caraganae TaxID=2763117 RepID=A0A370L2Y5_9HYPH|nr:LacI family DNA-binding transcriptional regulator [Bosea caraganae]RDJ30478.1 LacI family DNA-binding transcriptional regulator [Bosea caraganae]